MIAIGPGPFAILIGPGPARLIGPGPWHGPGPMTRASHVAWHGAHGPGPMSLSLVPVRAMARD